MHSWDLIKVLLALHRAGTFEGAALALHIDSTTVRRHLQALDRQVGATLFVRRDGQLVLAERHDALLGAALRMEAAYGEVLALSTRARSGGTIRVTTLDIFATLLAPDLAHLRRLHPDIQLELTTEPHFVDLERERIDLAIRLARPLRGVNGLKRLATMHFAVYGARAHRPAAAAGRDLLALYPHRGRMDHEFLLADERWHDEFRDGTIVARADGYPTLLRLCEEGMGLAMLPCLLGDASPLLERVGSARRTMPIGVWAVIRPDVRGLPKIRTLMAFLTETFRRHGPALMRGSAPPPGRG